MGLFSRLRAEPVYNTRAVVRQTGVPADTFRAWERRYGLPAPARTEGNQRLYSDRDIATIAWLRDQTRAGMTISQAVRLYRSRDVAMKRPANGGRASAPAPLELDEPGAERMAGFRDHVVDALARYDAAAAAKVIEEALVFYSVEDVCLHVLQAALYRIGDRWERGEVGVGVEHFASGFVIRKLGSLFNASQPERGLGPIVACCPEGELHEIGLLLTSLFLSREGFRIVYLGPNLPLADLLETAERLRPPVVILSASTTGTAGALTVAAQEIQAHYRRAGPGWSSPTVGFGGRVFVEQPELRQEVAGVFLGGSAEEAIAAVRRVLAGARA